MTKSPDVREKFASLGVGDLVKAAEDSLPLDLDDGVNDSLDGPHRGVVILSLPVTCRITHLQDYLH